VETNYLFEEYYMLVTFTTDAYADITMFGDVALAMLKMMGHSATVRTVRVGGTSTGLQWKPIIYSRSTTCW
jgi:hypothetical protein